MKRISLKYALIIALAILFCLGGCSKSHSPEKKEDYSYKVKEFEKALMEQYYYWAAEMRVPTNPKDYDVYTYFNALKVAKDRWSWMCDGRTYEESETGVSTSFGFHLKQPINYYKDYDVYVAYVDKNSPLGKAGVKRGWQLTKIKDFPIKNYISQGTLNEELNAQANTFTFLNLDNEEVRLDLSQSSFQANTVIASKIFDNSNCAELPSGTRVGYINYISFNSSLESEIINTLSQMKDGGINELILDLRYNGGGDLDLCTSVASLLAPASADKKTFLHIAHNAKQQKNDFYRKFARTAKSLNLNRLYFITTGATASASESIINGLTPYIDICSVGETTYGKPNGMYVILYPNNARTYSDVDYAFYPICFYCLNANEKADFENGITPTHTRYDDLYHDFDDSEDLIHSCLSLIATGALPPAPPASSKTKMATDQILPTAESAPNYGRATIRKEF